MLSTYGRAQDCEEGFEASGVQGEDCSKELEKFLVNSFAVHYKSDDEGLVEMERHEVFYSF